MNISQRTWLMRWRNPLSTCCLQKEPLRKFLRLCWPVTRQYHLIDWCNSHTSCWSIWWLKLNVLHSVTEIQDIANKLLEVRNPIGAMNLLLRELDFETDAETDSRLTTGTGRFAFSFVNHMRAHDEREVFPLKPQVSLYKCGSACLSCTAAA